jgi:hypothetical protein
MVRVYLRRALSATAWAAAAIISYSVTFICRSTKWLLLPVLWLMAVAALSLLVLLFIVPTTPRDVAYRNIDPQSALCDFDSDKPWDVLADASVDNNELNAISKFPAGDWEKKFSCSLQRHVIPSKSGETSLSYNLAFIEFREDGSPYELITDHGTPYSIDELSSRVRYVDEKKREPITQLRALTRLLGQNNGHNYVVVFIHGWRHDTRIGDENVSDLRSYAAHAARFLRERCQNGEQEQCDRVVTAVYIGWRGARINEETIEAPFVTVGNWLDGGVRRCRAIVDKKADTFVDESSAKPRCWRDILGSWGNGAANLATALTLFDRKPVSETIAPHVLTALRSIESTFDIEKNGTTIHYFDRINNPNRLLVIGHSLGGNLLATALERDVIKRVEWHSRRNDAGQHYYFDPPLGNLVVLINPASEARKWTSIQRAVWEKIVFRNGEGKSEDEYDEGHRFFPVYQRPVLIAVTSAFAWPPGGIRVEDCASAFNFNKDFKDDPTASAEAMKARHDETRLHEAITTVDDKSRSGGVSYDTATHDLFPFFKLDFRPMADRLERYGRFLAGQKVPRLSCDREVEVKSWWPWLLVKGAALLRDLPFQDTDMENTRTIGNLDAPRHAAGSLEDYLLTAKPFGTTHEIRGSKYASVSMPYTALAASLAFECRISDFWLSRARRHEKESNGMNWSSAELAQVTARENPKADSLAAQVNHGFYLAGMQPITRANDPFWNIRAYDDVVAEHDGYKKSAFICAINQLVMDPSTDVPPGIGSPAAPSQASKNPPENVPTAIPQAASKR